MKERVQAHPGVLSRWGHVLPLTADTPRFTLGEGDTPLIRSRRIGQRCGLDELWFKLEASNPTGSFKDRGMVVAVAKALEAGSRAVMCASTGNTSASAAAYAAHCGLSSYVLVPEGRVAAGKLAQAIAYGSQIIEVSGNFDAALATAREVTDRYPVALVNSVNPHRIEGQKTSAYEICETLGDAPEIVSLPVGNAGNITAYWKGFCECAERGYAARHPRMLGFQAAGAAPIVLGEPVAEPQTIATAIRIGNPASWEGATRARDESGGAIEAVSDDEIIAAYHALAREEGLFVEPASAAGVAGLLKLARESRLTGGVAVAILTGSGLKDPEAAMSTNEPDVRRTEPEVESVLKALGW